MKIARTVALIVAGAVLFGGCGSQQVDTQATAQGFIESTTTTAAPTTTTTEPATTTTTVDPRIVVRDVTTKEGWRYRITIAPATPDPNPTSDRCVPLAPPGQTNARWGMVVENLLTDRAAPWPFISAAINLNEAGTAVDRRATTPLKASFHGVNLAPNEMTLCYLRAVLDGGSRNEHMIEPGATEEFTITAGPVADPVPAGTQLLVDLGGPDQTVSVLAIPT
jgi:hypothetical protein